MKERTFANSASNSTPVPPQFDDERTVLTARRVVPLEQINTKVQHRRRWFLGGAFAIAMILGAASALVASYLQLRNTTTPVAEVEVSSAPLAVAESVPAESPVVEETEVLEETATEQPVPVESPKPEAPSRRRTVVKHTNNIPEPRDTEKVSEEEELDRIRDAVLFDEWQERRARRAARRERRLERYNHRDLSNLDEIFEGRRRRANPDPN